MMYFLLLVWGYSFKLGWIVRWYFLFFIGLCCRSFVLGRRGGEDWCFFLLFSIYLYNGYFILGMEVWKYKVLLDFILFCL